MGLRDFFKEKRIAKFASQKSNTDDLNLSDDEIAKNWVVCKSCGATIHNSEYTNNLHVCPNCSSHGRLDAWQRIDLLCDENSFKEFDAEITACDPLEFDDGIPYSERLIKAQSKTGSKEALITGIGKMEGTEAVLAVMNFSFIGGSMGAVVGEKFARAVDVAIAKGLPFIAVSSSGGARMQEGILSLMQMAKTSIALEKLEEAKLPFISLLTDPTFGGVAASFSSLGDIIIAEPAARVGFAGRRVIEETVREKLPDDFQTAEYLLEHGQVDMIIERKNLKACIAQIFRMHGFPGDESETANSRFSPNPVEKPKKEIPLEFEKPLLTIQKQISELEKKSKTTEEQELFNELKAQYSEVEANTYKNLSAIEITRTARHPNRPNSIDYLNLICDKWIEVHGDRAGTDDAAILTALAEIDGKAFVFVGTRKGRNIKENQLCNFGMPQPEGYRKAKRMFEYANKFSLPVITFIDTPGAYPGLNAESNGQSIAIAENLKALAKLEVPVISIVTGEGGSGGALAIGVSNKVLMLENSIYSVISPEGCAAILWRTRDKAPEAAEALKVTAKNLLDLGVIDGIIKEPLGGAHKDWNSISKAIRTELIKELSELESYSPAELKAQRAEKFYAYGVFEAKQKVHA